MTKISKEQQESSLVLNSFLTTIIEDDHEAMRILLKELEADEAFQVLISSIYLLKALLDVADLELQDRAGVQINFSGMLRANAAMILGAELEEDEGLDEG